MENKTEKSVSETAYGKKLDAPIGYQFSYTIYKDGDELVAAKDELTIAEQVKIRNTERKNNARQKALTAALDAAGIVKPTIENDDQLRLRETFKNLMSSKKYTEEAAKELAAQVLGLTWED